MRQSLLVLLVFSPSVFFGQGETIGLLHNAPGVSEGYTLFTTSTNNDAYLIDNCGELINNWTFSERPGQTCYLLENGNLLRVGLDSLEIRDWTGTLIWSYAMNNNGLPQHHDIEPLPNGNILALIRENITDTMAIAAGRDPAFAAATVQMERIVELEPVGTNNANIVWEWRFLDHLIQDFDPTKPNYGVVEQHPELIDFNYDNGESGNWLHLNAIEYSHMLDQIMISSRVMSEIYIIDHSTTTVEAAGHTGGISGKGGDFLWRWGNPQVYRQGGSADRKLYHQHDPQWVRPGYPDDGKISIFNNDADSTEMFSSVALIEPSFVNNAYSMTNNRFDPPDFDWSWSGSILGVVVDQNSRSGAQSQANGNITFCETGIGRFSEIDKAGNHIWTYVNPTGLGGNVYPQGTPTGSVFNTTFRAEKYPSNYVGFSGLPLTPNGIMENSNSNSMACDIVTGVQEEQHSIGVVNPSIGGAIEFTEPIVADGIEILSITGKTVLSRRNFTGQAIPVNLAHGTYLLKVTGNVSTKVYKVLVN